MATQRSTPQVAQDEIARQAVATLLRFMGENPQREGLRDTPARVVRMYRELCAGYSQDPRSILASRFTDDMDEMVVLSGIRFASLCEHHLLPFVGVVSVGYIPRRSVVGVSKLVRLVNCYARRLQIQERFTRQIADALQTHLRPRGIGVLVRAHHSCMGCRGVQQPDTTMTTSALRGVMRTDARARSEFLALTDAEMR